MDNETETVSDNELIAQFMGFRKTGKHFVMDGEKVEQYQHPSYGRCYPHEWDAFTRSWSWLMPVVEKISQHTYESWEDSNGYKDVTHYERAYPRTFGMMDSEGRWLVRINRMPLEQEDTLIKATHKAVVEWIKMINSQSPAER